jgi:predicted lipoprotein with Yx(FWY)xxD motif
MHVRLALTAGFTLASLALAACGSTTSSSSSSSGGGSGSATVSTGPTSNLGTVLTNSAGVTLYYLTTEQGGHAACDSACLNAWPSLTAPAGGSPAAGSGVTGTLTVITASDGSMEVAYNGWPLHTFSGDGGVAGTASGNGIKSFGGIWYASTPGLTASGAAGGGATTPSGTSPTAVPGY